MVCKALRDYGIKEFIDVHLMIDPVDELAQSFIKAGADLISFHPEASKHIHRSIHAIKEKDCKAGLVYNPATPLHTLENVLDDLDLVLIMSVNPGFGGQSFIPTVENKIRRLKAAVDAQVAAGGRPVQIQIDGGVKSHNIAMLREWGVGNCVVGSGLFNDNASVADNLAVIYQALE